MPLTVRSASDRTVRRGRGRGLLGFPDQVGDGRGALQRVVGDGGGQRPADPVGDPLGAGTSQGVGHGGRRERRTEPGQRAAVLRAGRAAGPAGATGQGDTVFEGKTTGTPIAMLIPNEDQRSKDYSHNTDVFRPSHADYTYQTKYGIRDHRGGGRSSARETAARVAAGALAKLLLKSTGD